MKRTAITLLTMLLAAGSVYSQNMEALSKSDSLLVSGVDLSKEGKYEEAMQVTAQAMTIIEETVGKEHPDYAVSLSNMAVYNSELGNYAEAIRLGREALEIRGRLLGKESTDYANSLSDLVNYYSDLGNYTEAIALGKKALDIYGEISGKDSSDYAKALNALSICYYYSGNYSESIQLGREALDIFERIPGNINSDYITSIRNLATYNSVLGKYEEAIQLETIALGFIEKLFGKDSLDYLYSLSNLSSYYYISGNYDEAFRLGEEALAMCKSLFGEWHPLYAMLLNNIAMYHSSLGNYAEAIRFATEALALIEKTLGKQHPDYVKTLNYLASYQSLTGNYTEAIQLETEALGIYEIILGKEHPDNIDLLSDLVYYQSQSGYYNESTPTYAISITQSFVKTISATIPYLTTKERTSFWNKYKRWFDNTLPLCTYSIQNDSLNVTAYDGVLLSKGLLLNSEIELNKILMESVDTAVVTKYQELKANKAMFDKIQEKSWSELELIEDTLEKEKRITQLQAKRDKLENIFEERKKELLQQANAYDGYIKNLNINWREVQKNLSDADAAIEFIDFEARNDSVMYIALTLTKDDACPHIVTLFEKKELNGVSRNELYTTTKMSDLVWKPLHNVLKEKKNIYFAPTGELHNIAIESLPDYEGKGLMSDKWNMYRLSSTRNIALKKENNEFKRADVYGGLIYDMDKKKLETDIVYIDTPSDDHERYNVADSLNLRSGVNELPATRTEVEDINKILKALKINTKLYTDSVGTESSFKTLSGKNSNLIHIATHGFYWTESEAKSRCNLGFLAIFKEDASSSNKPAITTIDTRSLYVEDKALTRSGLLFAGANYALKGERLPDGVNDGILTAKEISLLDLWGLDLVVLSACQTGLGEITGDGVFGLQRGFKKAGANTMLMSLWKVSDAATRMLMEQFYKGLLNKKTKLQALKEAQEYVRDYKEEKTVNMNGNLTPSQKRRMEREGVSTVSKTETQIVQPYESPLYWAAFILLDAID